MLFKGQTLGKYRILSPLGSGGFGTVYLARDTWLDKQVAIKVPHRQGLDFSELLREPRLLASVNHPNIVAVFDSGSDDGTHFIVTELVEGETLADRLRRDGPMPPVDAVAVAVDIARALASAHARGLIHRDIKPGNVMLLPDGRVKVVDFGIAGLLGQGSAGGKVMGTPEYMAPERAQGLGYDHRSDVYSLGVMAYEVLVGEVPLQGTTAVETLAMQVDEQPDRNGQTAERHRVQADVRLAQQDAGEPDR